MPSYCDKFLYDAAGYPVHHMSDDVREEIRPFVASGQLRPVKDAHPEYFSDRNQTATTLDKNRGNVLDFRPR